MRICSCLLFVSLAILAWNYAIDAAMVKALTNERSAGLETSDDVELLVRTKRQSTDGGDRLNHQQSPTVPVPAPAVNVTTNTSDFVENDNDTCSSVYRLASGQCNNMLNPEWGSANRAFKRLLPAEYDVINNEGNVVYAPRRYSEVDGSELPNVRLISRVVHGSDDRPSPNLTVMAMQWGQFFAHDISSTARNPSNKMCCSVDLVLNNSQHSDVITNGPCFPVIIPEEDHYYQDVYTRCLEIKRNHQTTVDGISEQINTISAFVDGSQVYGNSEEDMKNLRSDAKGKGRLLDNDNNLPESPEQDDQDLCVATRRDLGDYCLLAGDHRVNIYSGLGALNTVFMRMHNVLADGLSGTHSDWDDEKVFQEARRINIALLQKISYSDWLRLIVGDAAMSEYGFHSGNFEYDESIDPTLYNVIATSALRFGHSMVPKGLVINNVLEADSLVSDPHFVLHSLDSIIEGLVMDVSQRVDRMFTSMMTNSLRTTDPFIGFDMAAVSILRGRDHGLPPYYKWRALCDPDEGVIESFAELGDEGKRIASVYRDIRDVDILTGALQEIPVTGGSLGKTIGCLLQPQFRKLKYGDRFWYENPTSPHPFSEEQIREVEMQDLATIICLTTGISSIQRDVFNLESDSNPRIDCSSVKPMDYTLF